MTQIANTGFLPFKLNNNAAVSVPDAIAPQLQTTRGPVYSDNGASTQPSIQSPAYVQTPTYAPPKTTLSAPGSSTPVPLANAAASTSSTDGYISYAPGAYGSAIVAAPLPATSAGGVQDSSSVISHPADSTVPVNSAISSPYSDALQNLVTSLSQGSNAGSSPGYGTGSQDTSLPSPTAADVAALQPTVTPTQTTSSGFGTVVILALIALVGVGIYFYVKRGGKIL